MIRHSVGIILAVPFITTRDYQLPLHCYTLLDKRCLSHGMCLYQVIMTFQLLNDVANENESTQKSTITS